MAETISSITNIITQTEALNGSVEKQTRGTDSRLPFAHLQQEAWISICRLTKKLAVIQI
jgi:hypothetical protein